MMKDGSEVTVVSGKNNVWLASSDILLSGPFESTEEMNVIQEERVEINKTRDGVKNKSTKATTDEGNNNNNNNNNKERVERIEKKDDSICDQSTEAKLPAKEPSLTERQDDVMRKKFEMVEIKMMAGRRSTYYHRCENVLNSSKTCLWLFCSRCTGNKQVEENRKGEEKDFGCKHGKADLIPCTNAETMTRLTCEYIYASEDARNGYIPSRCVGCHKRIAIDLDNEKADQLEIRPIET
jgi:hypothetical protein